MLPEDAPESELEIANCPAAPLVPLTIESRDPDESVITLEVTPMPAELIAEESDASVVSLSALSTLKVVFPIFRVPESVSLGFEIAVETSDEVCARLPTNLVCRLLLEKKKQKQEQHTTRHRARA